MTTVADLIATLDAAYPPGLAQSWDSVGLVCGEPEAELTRVIFAVDATAAVVDAALDWNAQALVVHHPLLLRGVDTVAASTPKGALLHRLIQGGCALFTAHTNADSANPGVSDALATTLGLRVAGPLDPKPEPALDKWSVQVPLAAAGRVAAAMFAAGAGTEPGYEQAAWRVTGTGQFRPVAGAHPAIGTIGTLEHVAEERIDTLAPRHLRTAVLAALRAAHPYESPGFHISERAPLDSALGIGRIGTLAEPETLRAFTDRVARALPATAWGVRAAGDPDRIVRTVAVCGGAGDSLLAAATRAEADAYVTSDLRHHPVDEQLRAGGPALVDVAHWASEFPWCAQAAATVAAALPGIETQVCSIRTDPWTLHAAGESLDWR